MTHRLVTPPRLVASALCWAMSVSVVAGAAAVEQKRSYDLPSGDAATTLNQFAGASGQQIIFMMDKVKGERTNAIVGDYAARDALDRMLAGTGLSAARDPATGAFVVSRKPQKGEVGPASDPKPNPKKMTSRSNSARLAAVFAAIASAVSSAQTPATATGPTSPGDDAIVLKAFTISTDRDDGYRAANSISATRAQAAIKDLPFAMNAYTEEFIRDLNTNDLGDVLRFAPNVANASNDFANGDLRFNIRGFSTNIVQRNGLQGLRNTSMNNVARVEVVKGPASVLYGQVAPGGIVNFITKKPLEKPYSELRMQIGNERTSRTDIDTTGPISREHGLFYRLNGTYTDYSRALDPFHQVRYSVAPSLLWNLFGKKDVTVSLDYERYYSYEDPPAWARPNTVVWGYDIDARGNLSYVPNAAGPAPSKGSNAPFNYDLPENFNQVANTDFRRVRIQNVVAEMNAKLPGDIQLRVASSIYSYDTVYLTSGIASFFNAGSFVTAPSTADPRNATNAPILTADVLRTNPNGTIIYAPVRNPDGSIAQRSDNLMQRRMSSEHFAGTTRRHQVDVYRVFDFPWVKIRATAGLDWADSWSLSRNARIKDALWSNLTWKLNDPTTWNRTNPWPNNIVTDLSNARQLVVVTDPNYPGTYQGGQFEGAGTPVYGEYGLVRAGFFDDRLIALGGLRRTTIKTNVPISKNTPQAGLTFKVTPQLSVYASYSEAFIPNNNRKIVESVDVGVQDPTLGKGIDAGVKMDFFNGRLSGALSFFKTKNSGIVTQITTFNSTGQLVITTDQNSEQESSGLELDAVIQLSRSWKTYLSYGYQDPKISAQLDRPWMVGTQLDDSAKTTAALQTRYDFKKGNYRGLYFGAGFTYTGTKVQRSATQSRLPVSRDPVTLALINPPGNGPAYQFKADPYTLVNLFAGYNFTRGKFGYTVSLNMTNVFNEFYMPSDLSRGDDRRYSMSFTVRR